MGRKSSAAIELLPVVWKIAACAGVGIFAPETVVASAGGSIALNVLGGWAADVIEKFPSLRFFRRKDQPNHDLQKAFARAVAQACEDLKLEEIIRKKTASLTDLRPPYHAYTENFINALLRSPEETLGIDSDNPSLVAFLEAPSPATFRPLAAVFGENNLPGLDDDLRAKIITALYQQIAARFWDEVKNSHLAWRAYSGYVFTEFRASLGSLVSGQERILKKLEEREKEIRPPLKEEEAKHLREEDRTAEIPNDVLEAIESARERLDEEFAKFSEIAHQIRSDLRTVKQGQCSLKKMVATVIVLVSCLLFITQRGIFRLFHGQRQVSSNLSSQILSNEALTIQQIDETRRLKNEFEKINISLQSRQTSEARNAIEHSPAEIDVSADVRKAFDAYDLQDGKNDSQGRFLAAENLVNAASGNARAWFLRGYSAFQHAKASEPSETDQYFKIAAESYTKAIDLIGPKNHPDLLPLTHTNLGAAQSYLGDLATAEGNHKQAIHLNPNLALAYLNLENVYALMGPEFRDKQIRTLRDGYAATPDSKGIKDRLATELRKLAFDMERPFRVRIAAMQEVLAMPDPPFEWQIESVLVFLMAQMPEEEARALDKAESLAKTIHEKAEVAIFQADLRKRMEHEYSPATDPGFIGVGAAIKAELEEVANRNEDVERLCYLAACYEFLAGNRETAENHAARIPESCNFRLKYDLIRNNELSRGLSFRLEQIAGSGLDQKESEKKLTEVLGEHFSKIFKSGGEFDPPNPLAKDFESLVSDCMKLYLRQDWKGMLVVANQHRLKHDGGVIFGVSSAYAGFAKFHLDDFQGAVDEFERGFEHDQIMEETMSLYYARALVMVGRRVEAEQLFRELCRKNPKNSEPVRYLSMMLDHLGRRDEAICLLKEFLSIVPDDSSIGDLCAFFLYKEAEHLVESLPKVAGQESRLSVASQICSKYIESFNIDSNPRNKQMALADFALIFTHILEETAASDEISGLLKGINPATDCSDYENLTSGLEGILRYTTAIQKWGGIELIPLNESEEIGRLLAKGVLSERRPFAWDVAFAWIKTRSGMGFQSTDHLLQLIDQGHLVGLDSNAIATLHLDVAHIHSFQAVGDPARPDLAMVRSGLKHFDKALEMSPSLRPSGFIWEVIGNNRRFIRDYKGSIIAYTEAIREDPGRYGAWINLCDGQLRALDLPAAMMSSISSFRYFPWSSPSQYRNLFPMLGNLLIAFALIWIPVVAFFAPRWFRRWRQWRGVKSVGVTDASVASSI